MAVKVTNDGKITRYGTKHTPTKSKVTNKSSNKSAKTASISKQTPFFLEAKTASISKQTPFYLEAKTKNVFFHVTAPGSMDKVLLAEQIKAAIEKGGILVTTPDVTIISYTATK